VFYFFFSLLASLMHNDRKRETETYLYEVDKLESVASVIEVEIDTVGHFANGEGVGVGRVLQDELFQEEERSLVIDLLSHLRDRSPGVFGLRSRASRALIRLHDVLDDERLLQDGRSKHFSVMRYYSFSNMASISN